MHFIAMAGLHGCIPNHCEVFPSFPEAVGDLAELHNLGPRRRAQLWQARYLELEPHPHVASHKGDCPCAVCSREPDGNEYCEIQECFCMHPEAHSDSQ